MILISIDPGSYQTGVGIWEGAGLVAVHLLSQSKSTPYLKRVQNLLEALAFTAGDYGCESLAVERPPNYPQYKSPELDVYYRQIGAMARAHRWPLTAYYPSEVAKAVHFGGGFKGTAKEKTRMGVFALYGEEWPHCRSWDQNVIDAVAVGHCHIGKMKEQQLIGS